MIGKTCPRCAERVKSAAKVCRHCGHEFSQDEAAVDLTKTDISDPTVRKTKWILAAAIAGVALILAVVLGYAMTPEIEQNPGPEQEVRTATTTIPPIETDTDIEEIKAGEALEWSAESAPAETVRRMGPYTVRVTGKTEDEMIAPVVDVEIDGQKVQMVGELTSDSYTHYMQTFQNARGQAPAILFQSFSGGAHCCTTIQVAEIVKGRLTVTNLGAWDGEGVEPPTDISGDGVADFIMTDNAFHYAFAGYAMSYAPPIILNVVNGRVVNVSAKSSFKSLYAEELKEAEAYCRDAEDPMVHNGVCAGYIAIAARSGQLDRAWMQMMRSYTGDAEWDLPTGCQITTTGPCPEGGEIVYGSYPEALLAFLKRTGYVPSDWNPPGAE